MSYNPSEQQTHLKALLYPSPAVQPLYCGIAIVTTPVSTTACKKGRVVPTYLKQNVHGLLSMKPCAKTPALIIFSMV
jgi:hypothetical protein